MRDVFAIRMRVYKLQISLYDSHKNAPSRGRKIELSYDTYVLCRRRNCFYFFTILQANRKKLPHSVKPYFKFVYDYYS